MGDEMTVVGVDGIRRSFGEHYDTVMEVETDPTGAMWAIHKQADRIEELEDKLAKSEALLAKAVVTLGELADCVDDGCYCSEMQMATAMDIARTTLAAVSETHKLKGETE